MTTISDYNGYKFNAPVRVQLPLDLTVDEFAQLLPSQSSQKPAYTFPALHNWLSRLLNNLQQQEDERHPYHKHPYHLREINIQSVDWFWRNRPGQEDKLGFMKIISKIETDSYIHEGEDKARPDWLPGAVFLRGGSVAMLIIVQPSDATGDDEKFVLLTVQPRIAAGSLAFTEIPAGMLDGGTFKGTAANEVEEEAHIKVKEDDLINMSELALAPQREEGANSRSELPVGESSPKEDIEAAMYPSVGACDEFIPLFLCQKRLTRRHLDWLRGRATGLRDEGENITLEVVPLSDAWKRGARDAKTLAALMLYEGLSREGRIPNMPDEIENEPEEVSS